MEQFIYHDEVKTSTFDDLRKKQPEKYYHNEIVIYFWLFFTINYSAEIAPKPQEFRQVPQSTQTLASIE